MSPSKFMASILFFPVCLSGQAVHSAAADPERFHLVTSDIEHFWQAYDLAYPWFFPEIFDSLYLRRASAGLQAFRALNLENVDSFCRKVREGWDYYESVRPATEQIRKYEPEIRAAAFALKYLYPEAQFPDVYFVIGERESGALILDKRLIINAEQFCSRPASPTRARRTGPSGHDIRLLPAFVARELAFFQQCYPKPRTLLERSIREGVADLIAELVSGQRLYQEPEELTAGNEADIWSAFLADKDAWNSSRWFRDIAPDHPADPGRWIGYRIARAYYDRADDKRSAIFNMLHIDDFDCFFEDSQVLEGL